MRALVQAVLAGSLLIGLVFSGCDVPDGMPKGSNTAGRGGAGTGSAGAGGASGGSTPPGASGGSGGAGTTGGSGGAGGASAAGGTTGGTGTGGTAGSGATAGTGGSDNTGSGGSAGDAGAADTGGGGGTTGTPSAPLGDGFKQAQLGGSIGLGYFTACHVLTDNSIRCFGDRHPRTMPPAGLKTNQIACGHDGCCAVMPKEAGSRIRCWSDKRTIYPPDAVARSVDPIWLAIGYQHGCVINVDQTVTCWGQPGTNAAPPPGLKAKQLHAAAYFNCAVKLDDSVVCWGVNPPMPPADLKAKLVAGIFHGGGHLGAEAQMGTRHACAIQLDDTVRCWGDNVAGTTDVPANLGPVRDVAGSTYSTCAAKPDGEVVCWGTRKLFDDPARYKPMPAGIKLRAIRGNFGCYCGRQLDDTLVCWGDEKTSHLTVTPVTKLFVPPS